MSPHAAQGFETVDDAGDGAPWLVLVHAASQDRRVFDRQVAAFRASHRILLVDLPGHGRSAQVAGPFGHEELADAVASAIAAAGAHRPHYFGTHTGAAVGLVLAARRVPALASLALEGAVLPGTAPPSVTEIVAALGALARREGPAAAREHWWSRSPWFEVMRDRPRRCRAAAHRAIVDDFGCAPWIDVTPARAVARIETRLADIDVPVLLVNGEQEVADFVPVADALERGLPDVRRVRIPDGGGFPFWEYPDRVNAVLAEFLDRPR